MACLEGWLTESLGRQQSSPGRLDNLQEGNLGGTGTGHPHVSEDELMGKKTGLDEQGTLVGLQEKEESLWALEEGTVNA